MLVFHISRRLFSHTPVMADEIVKILRPDNGKVFIDMTFGGGGHTRRLLDTNKSITVVAVDRDPVAYKKSQELAAEIAIKSERLNIKQTVIPICGKFSSVLKDIHLSGIPYGSVNGVLFDLGASSMQYDDSNRGFSISLDGPLDMRMDKTNDSHITAEDVVNNLKQEELAFILKTYGQEKRSRKISNAILDARTILGRIRTTKELARIINSNCPAHIDSLGRFAHPATKTFQALRIFVNNELNELNYVLDKVREFLIPSQLEESTDAQELEEVANTYGVAVVLTFHSLEDTIVKRHFTGVDIDAPSFKWLSQHDRIRTNSNIRTLKELDNFEKDKKWRSIFKHVKKPSDVELAANPRGRSAKLRAALRVA